MVARIRHVGIVSLSLETSVSFWERLGFQIVVQADEANQYASRLLGEPLASLRTVKMSDSSSSEVLIELLHPIPNSTGGPASPVRQGITHVALTVSSIRDTLQAINDFKVEMLSSETQASPDGKVLVCYLRCPDNVLIELVELT